MAGQGRPRPDPHRCFFFPRNFNQPDLGKATVADVAAGAVAAAVVVAVTSSAGGLQVWFVALCDRWPVVGKFGVVLL